MPSKKPRATARATAPAKTRKVPPNKHTLKRLIPRESRQMNYFGSALPYKGKLKRLIPRKSRQMNNRQRMVFENLVRQKTLGQALPETKMRRIAQRCAERALGLDLRIKETNQERIQRMKRYESRINKILQSDRPFLRTTQEKKRTLVTTLSGLPELKRLLFESGAEMNARLDIGRHLFDPPRNFPGIRVIAEPAASEHSIKGFSEHLEKLKKTNKADYVTPITDTSPNLRNGIGYLGISIAKTSKKTQFKKGEEVTGIIAIRQERFLPEFPESIRKRYQNWDTELLRYVEATLKRGGVKRMAILIRRNPKESILPQMQKFRARAERNGYRERKIEFTEMLLEGTKEIQEARTAVLVKDI